jgi:hypothetical protein
MPKKSESNWSSGLVVNLVSNFIAAIVGGIVTYFSHEGSVWVKPLLFGGVAWLITFCSILAVRFMRRIPSKVDPVTVENVKRRIRDWFDDFNLGVKTVQDDDTYFGFLVTTDNGKKIAVIRSKKITPNHLIVRGLITLSEEERKIISGLTDDEKTAMRLAIQLELSRAVIGYTTQDILEELTIFKSIPITESLTAEEIINTIWTVEATLNSIFIVGAMNIHRHNINEKTKSGIHETETSKRDVGTKEPPGNEGQTLTHSEATVSRANT